MVKNVLLSSQKNINLIASFQVFVFVDLLFFPRILFAFGIPVSLLIIGMSFFYRPLQLNRFIMALGMLVVMLTSVIYGTLSGNNSIPEESLKRAIQLFTILLYALFQLNNDKLLPVLVKILRFFYLWTFCLMLLFFLRPEIYQQLVAFVYPETLDQLENTLENLRFSYFYSDPNSAAYIICFTLVAYLFIEKKLNWGVISSTMAVLTIIATQSRGAYISAAVIILYFGITFKSSIQKKILITCGSCLVLLSLVSFYSDELNLAYSIFDARLEQEEDLGGGRSGKYRYFFDNFNFLPFGSGYHLQINGDEFRPHSDLIRINLSYGILTLPLIFYFVFPRRKSQVLLFIIFLVPFLINTVIDDYRLFGLYLLFFRALEKIDNPFQKK